MQRHFRNKVLSLPGRCATLFSELKLAVRLYRTDWVTLLRRLAYLRSHCGLHPREAMRDGLLDMQLPKSALAATISKRAMVELQGRVNPSQFDCLTEDKAIFYAYCGALGLPIPRQFGVATRPVGHSAEGQPLRNTEEWQGFVAELPDEFVVKPSQGVYGRGVEVFRREGSDFIGSSSGRHLKQDMDTAFFTDPRYSSFVIQERLYAHPALQELSGTPCIQTVRIVTDVDELGTVRIVFAVLRIITGELVIDNFDGGRTGNLLSCVELSGGTLDFALGVPLSGIGIVQVSHHPKTGVSFRDFRLPDWEATCALAKRAAILFLPLRTLGWDIALTLGGPRIIEANKRWDPCNELALHAHKPAMIEGIVALIGQLRKAPRR
jgi:hypothetical protein